MAFTRTSLPTMVKQPRVWPLTLSLTDGTAWRQCVTAGGNGSKIVSARVVNSDAAKILQMGIGRRASVTATNATPAVFTWAGHILSVGDQIILGGTTVPTGFTAGTTYYVSLTNLDRAAGTFSLSTTLANAAAGTNVASSSTGTAVTATVIRPTGSLSVAATAGFDGTTAAANFFNNSLMPAATDQDQNSYEYIEDQDFLYFSVTVALASAKNIWITATDGDF